MYDSVVVQLVAALILVFKLSVVLVQLVLHSLLVLCMNVCNDSKSTSALHNSMYAQ
jgi:hypothetical protein